MDPGLLAGKSDQPMSYSNFGAACTEVEIDTLTGERIVLQTDILFDCGQSFNPAVDIGQVRMWGAAAHAGSSDGRTAACSRTERLV